MGRLDSKQLRVNAGKSKYAVIRDLNSRTSCLKEAEEGPIMMGTYKLENSTADSYLGYQIS